MRKALVALPLVLLAGCGGSSKPASPAPSAPPPVQAAAKPSAEQIATAKDLAAKLGCPNVTVTQGGPPMSAATECQFHPDYSVLAGEPTDFTASIDVYASQADRDVARARLNSLGHFRGAQGPTWVVTCDEDPAVERQTVRLTGGQQLNAIG